MVRPSDSLAKSRLKQVFGYLKELNEVRNPVPRNLAGTDVLRIDEWPQHPSVQVQRGDNFQARNEGSQNDAEPLIRIQRPKPTQCPPPTEVLTNWICPGWQELDGELIVGEMANF